MRELPLLACDRVALNLRSGRQTQHRVPIRWPDWVDRKERNRFGDGWRTRPHERVGFFKDGLPRRSFGAPWQPGDMLYVREAHQFRHEPCTCQREPHEWYGRLPHSIAVPRGWRMRYRASGESAVRWRPSILMPKWAARTWLKVTRVWAEEASEWTEEVARAEGFESLAGFEDCMRSAYGPELPRWWWACELELDRERSGVTP